MKIKAYGKVNISLDVVGKREDGYHLLSMIMQNIDLYDAIDRLDEKYKTPVILQYFHDLTIPQIAEIMECNENTVKSYIRRAKKKLYDILKEEK